MIKINMRDQEPELRILERAFMEVKARENIINFMLSNDMKNSPQYNEYWEEYLEYLTAYRIISKDFIENVVKPKFDNKEIKKWEADFEHMEMKIYE